MSAVTEETPRVRTLVLDIDGWTGHRAGQHLDVRLTAEDGYRAERAYSIASSPELGDVEVTVELVEGGEVSPYLIEVVRPGDVIEVRGPPGDDPVRPSRPDSAAQATGPRGRGSRATPRNPARRAR